MILMMMILVMLLLSYMLVLQNLFQGLLKMPFGHVNGIFIVLLMLLLLDQLMVTQ